MKRSWSFLTALTISITGCADIQQQTGLDNKQMGATAGAAIGCLGGAFLAKISGGKPAQGCAAGAVIGGLAGYEKARQEEIAAAEKAKSEALAALATLPPTQRTPSATIQTVDVTVTDSKTNEQRKYKAFDSVTIDIPLSAKGTPELDSAMSKLKTLATRVADERGSSAIVIAMTPGDVKATKTELTNASFKTPNQHDIFFFKIADDNVPKGVERITVRAGQLNTTI
jgi:hypothetical protein